MLKQVVISRYKENVSWTESLKIPVIIYDKFDNKDLPNIGRDLHTYAHHICVNYNNLADVTFFLQGNPFDHCHDVIRIIQETQNIDFLPLTDIYRLVHKTGLPYHAYLPMDRIFQELTGQLLPTLITFISGAMFAASREKIRSHPQRMYQRMAEMATEHPYYPHIFERLIAILIDGDKWGIGQHHPNLRTNLEMLVNSLKGSKDLIVEQPL